MLTFFNPNTTTLTPSQRREETGLYRFIAINMHLFGLCRYKRCFRERTCLHDPRAFMRAMLEGRLRDFDFDRMKSGHEDEMEEFAYWHALVENTRTPGAVELKYLFEREEENPEEEM